jgi:DNA-binding NarL/FixJ family response regulator
MADKLRVMLVDDHYLVRMGLASIIALEPDMTVCAGRRPVNRRRPSSAPSGLTSR